MSYGRTKNNFGDQKRTRLNGAPQSGLQTNRNGTARGHGQNQQGLQRGMKASQLPRFQQQNESPERDKTQEDEIRQTPKDTSKTGAVREDIPVR